MLNKIRKYLAKSIYPSIFNKSYFTSPVLFKKEGDYSINERPIEWYYVLSRINIDEYKKKILDFGCTNSWISLALSYYGNNVHSIDLRDYPFKHKNLTFNRVNIIEFNEGNFDYVISLSTLEHVGLGVYGEKYNPDAIEIVLKKINSLLKIGGKFILTLPVGEAIVNSFFVSFTPDEIKNKIINEKFILENESYFYRTEYKYWNKCTINEIKSISNDMKILKGKSTGVNGLGCFTFKKMEDLNA